MGLRGYLYLAGLVALAVSHLWFYNHGKAVCQAEAMQGVVAAKAREDDLISDVLRDQLNLKLWYDKRYRLIRETKDACLDSRLPQPLLDLLRDNAPSR